MVHYDMTFSIHVELVGGQMQVSDAFRV